MLDTFYKMAMLTAECQHVIGLRMAKAAFGGAAADQETLLMWSEKSQAAMRFGPAWMSGGTLDQMIDDYRGIVHANAVRLSGG